VIVPIYTKETKSMVLEKCGMILGKLKERGYRTHLDDREQYTPGFKFNEWELKGVPLRIEIGPKDISVNKVSLVRRDNSVRALVDEDKLEDLIVELLDSIEHCLKKEAADLLSIVDAKDYADLKKKLKDGGFIRIPFCMREVCAKKFKDETGAEVRGTLFGKTEKAEGKCVICGEKAKEMVYIAKAY